MSVPHVRAREADDAAALAQGRADPSRLTFVLPAPPSVNACYANVPGKGRVRSDRYRKWANAAGWSLKSGTRGSFAGRVRIHIRLSETSRLDLGNCEKPITDLLVTHGVIPDDRKKFVGEILLSWAPVEGVVVTVEPFGVET